MRCTKHEPYSAYDRVKFKEILFTEGDTYHRYIARIDEMWESMNIIEQLIDNIPEGPLCSKDEAGYKSCLKESIIRGLKQQEGNWCVYMISDGNKNPYRVKFRSPNFVNLIRVLNHIAKGFKIADLVAIGGVTGFGDSGY